MSDLSENKNNNIGPVQEKGTPEKGTMDDQFSERADEIADALEEGPEEVIGIELDARDEESQEINPPSSQTDNFIMTKLDDVDKKLDLLSQEFQEKLKNDSLKEKIIDDLHNELQEYKKDIFKKQFRSMILDLINIIDDLRKLSKHHREKGAPDNDFEKLLGQLELIPSDLEDIFKNHGITPFTCSGDNFDPKRQKILNKVETMDKASDKTIAKSLRPGYEWDGWVIRPEMVEACIYKEPQDE
jgi:molecular chaperone GrpE (heat shock protein)